MRVWKKHLGIPGIISVIALVFAMFGGAYAASNNSGGDKATASKAGPPGPRGPRGPRGKQGKPGPAGTNGTNGSNGANGKDGAAGAPGKNGEDGEEGEDGKSVIATQLPAGECANEQGGTEFEVEGSGNPEEVCNGAPWSAGGTLPPGESLKGVWSFGLITPGNVTAIPISFGIPLAEGLDLTEVHFINPAGKEVILDSGGEFEEATSTKCLGSVTNPEAEPSNLCVYAKTQSGFATFTDFNNHFGAGSIIDPSTNQPGAAAFGASMAANPTASNMIGRGTWAVTAPEVP